MPVIAGRGQRNIYDCSSHSDKDCMTVLVMVNAEGQIAPPMALFSFERIPGSISETAPPRWGIGRSKNSWMTCETFFGYIANVFVPYLKEIKTKLPVIIFLDRHKSHMNLPLSKFCKENGIILVALLPNATHILQPLDVAFFRPLKLKWRSILNEYTIKNHGVEPRRKDAISILDHLLEGDKFKTSISNGFRGTGICPFNVNAVDFSKCIKSNDGPTSNTDEENDNEKSDRIFLLQEFERRLPGWMMSEFSNTQNSKWNGDVRLEGLFLFYRSIENREHFEDVWGSSTENQDQFEDVWPSSIDYLEHFQDWPNSTHMAEQNIVFDFPELSDLRASTADDFHEGNRGR